MLRKPLLSLQFVPFLLSLGLTLPSPAHAALPAGTVIEQGGITCPTPIPPVPPGGHVTCGRITVTGCPGAPDLGATVWIVTLGSTPTLKGTIFLHNGGGGTSSFTSGGSAHQTLEANYEAAGFQLVDIAWDSTWEQTTSTSILDGACRPASVARWAFSSPHIHNGRRNLGFCGQGHSGGSAVLGYLLAEYGLDDTFDFVMLTAGPVFSRVDCGCDTAAPGCAMTQLCPELPLSLMQSHLGYGNTTWLDNLTGTTTCGQNTGSNPGDPIWKADSVVTAPGADLVYPQTGVRAWYCVEPTTLNNSAAEGSYFIHSVTQLGNPPDVLCTATGCTGEGVYTGTRNGIPVTTLMTQEMTASCIPRH